MFRSQIISGDIRAGGHRYVVVGVNARDNCGSAANSVCAGLGLSVTQLKHVAKCGDVGGMVRLDARGSHGRPITVLGLVLRRDRLLPIRIEDVRTAVAELVRFLRHADRGLRTGDAAMVAIGTGGGHLLGGFATLVRVLIDEGYPGLVYEPTEPGHRLSDAALRQLGVRGAAGDPLPPWPGGAADLMPPDHATAPPAAAVVHTDTHR